MTKYLETCPELTGGLPIGPLQHHIRHFPRGFLVQMTDLVEDHPSLGQVDRPVVQGRPDSGQFLDQILGKGEMKLGGATGPGKCGTDLG